MKPALVLWQLDSCDEGLCGHDWDFANNRSMLGSLVVDNSVKKDGGCTTDGTVAADVDDNVDCHSDGHECHRGIDTLALAAHSDHGPEHVSGEINVIVLIMMVHLRGGCIQALLYLSAPDETHDNADCCSDYPECHSGSGHHNGRMSPRPPMHERQMVVRPSHYVQQEDNALVLGGHADNVLR